MTRQGKEKLDVILIRSAGGGCAESRNLLLGGSLHASLYPILRDSLDHSLREKLEEVVL
jgi:hypothetical protein